MKRTPEELTKETRNAKELSDDELKKVVGGKEALNCNEQQENGKTFSADLINDGAK